MLEDECVGGDVCCPVRHQQPVARAREGENGQFPLEKARSMALVTIGSFLRCRFRWLFNPRKPVSTFPPMEARRTLGHPLHVESTSGFVAATMVPEGGFGNA